MSRVTRETFDSHKSPMSPMSQSPMSQMNQSPNCRLKSLRFENLLPTVACEKKENYLKAQKMFLKYIE